MAEQCSSHDACFAGVAQQVAAIRDILQQTTRDWDRRMNENAGKLNRLLERSEQWMLHTSTALNEIAALKQDIAEIKDVQRQQWEAINALRRTVYVGVGVALAVSTGLPIALKVVL